jgi:hypothetical protein
VLPVKRTSIPVRVLLIVILQVSLGLASPKTYQTGKLLSVQSPETVIPMPLVLGPSLPVHLSYQFEVQQGDIVYVGYCQRRDYKAEWRVGDDVQFRLRKDKMYLKRPNGKEFILIFLLQAKLGTDGKPVTIFSYKKR